MIPEAAFAMLACTRIGAIHSVVFGGFSPDSIAGPVHDCDSNIIITSDEGLRGGRKVALKAIVVVAVESYHSVNTVVLVRTTGGELAIHAGRAFWYHAAPSGVRAD